VWVCIVVQTAKWVRKGAKIGFVFVRFWIKLLIINRFLALFLLKISPFRLIFPYCLVPALPNLSINSSLTSWYCQGGGFATAIAADAAGNAYVTGLTVATDFPVVNAFQPTYAGNSCSDDCGNAFVTKIDAAGNALVYSTYLGGASNGSTRSQGSGIVVDSTGSAYVTGSTSTPDFPTTANAFQPTFAGFIDAFVTKFNPGGSTLAYSTYLGAGNGTETDGQGIAVDSTGNAYVAGSTNSTSFPTTAGAFQTGCGGGPTTGGDCNLDGFLIKLKADGSSLIYSTYLGGAGDDQAKGIAVDSSGSAYVTGATSSNDFPTLNALQTQGGGTNAFVTKFAPDGSSLIYSTYLGGISGESRDSGSAIALDSAGNAYITGQSNSSNFPTANAIQSQLGSAAGNAFVACLAPSGGALIYSTYLGGSGSDSIESVLDRLDCRNGLRDPEQQADGGRQRFEHPDGHAIFLRFGDSDQHDRLHDVFERGVERKHFCGI